MTETPPPKLCGDAGGVTAAGKPCRRRSFQGGRCAQHSGAHPGGRPPFVFSDDQIGQVEKLAAMLPMAKIADFFGISEVTLREKFLQDPRVSLAYTRGRANVEAAMARSVIVAGTNGDLQAAQFYLRTQAGWSDKQKVEHTGADGGDIKTSSSITVRFVDDGHDDDGDGDS